MERLHQTHDSLRAYRPTGVSIEAILGQAEAPQETERPLWLKLVNTDQVPEPGFCVDPTPLHPRWMRESPAGVEAIPAEGTRVLRQPFFTYSGSAAAFASADLVRIPVNEQDWRALTAKVHPVDARVQPVYNLALDLVIEGEAIEELVEIVKEAEAVPSMAGLLTLLRPSLRNCAAVLIWADSSPIAILLRAQLPPDFSSARTCDTAPMVAGSLPVAACGIAKLARVTLGTAQALELRRDAALPEFTLSTPPMRPRLRLAAGRRYAVRLSESTAQAADLMALPTAPVAVTIPERRVKVAPARNPKQAAPPAPMQEPNRAGLVTLPRTAKPAASGTKLMKPSGVASMPQPSHTDPMRPALRAEPVDAPAISAVTPDFAISLPPYAEIEAAAERPRAHLWTHAMDFVHRAPRDLKLLAIAIPVLLGLALHPALPKVRVASRANTSGMENTVKQAMNTQWTNVRQSLVDRAAVALDEDFRTGLDDWASRWSARNDGNAEWSFDATGFVRPGPLALYKPSVDLTDYQMQFLGMIDKKALSWVVRAADFDNYYVVKLEVLKPGPLPTIGVTRYAVVNGKADSRKDTVVPIDARPDMLYRVRMDVHGDDFALTVQGQMVDRWTEPRLRTAASDSSRRAVKTAACAGCRSRISTTCSDVCARIWRLTTFHRRTGAWQP